MNQEILDILKRISKFKIAKFTLSLNNRIFIEKLNIDSDYLNKTIEEKGEGVVLEFFKFILVDLEFIEENVDNIKEENNTNQKIEEYFNKDLLEIEKQKNILIINKIKKDNENFINSIKDKLSKEEEDKIKYQEILNKLNN